jgi:hypothetical protein
MIQILCLFQTVDNSNQETQGNKCTGCKNEYQHSIKGTILLSSTVPAPIIRGSILKFPRPWQIKPMLIHRGMMPQHCFLQAKASPA